MYKVKQLYVPYEDEDGHTYLIPKDDWNKFEDCLSRIEDNYSEHNKYDIYMDELTYVLETFADDRLEGEFHYVVLEDDLIGDLNAK